MTLSSYPAISRPLFYSVAFAPDGGVLIPSVINLQINDNPLSAFIDMGLVHFFYENEQGVQVRHFNGSRHPADFIGVAGFFDHLNSLFDKPA